MRRLSIARSACNAHTAHEKKIFVVYKKSTVAQRGMSYIPSSNVSSIPNVILCIPNPLPGQAQECNQSSMPHEPSYIPQPMPLPGQAQECTPSVQQDPRAYAGQLDTRECSMKLKIKTVANGGQGCGDSASECNERGTGEKEMPVGYCDSECAPGAQSMPAMQHACLYGVRRYTMPPDRDSASECNERCTAKKNTPVGFCDSECAPGPQSMPDMQYACLYLSLIHI